ncbi:MAG: CHC2 zinc finger domain-containing protein [Gammaproteobacteria bacterium]
MRDTSTGPDLASLKRLVDLVALAQARGVALKKTGAEYVGRCPFHEDHTPSFHISPTKNLFHCFGCGAAGSVVDFVMKQDGLSLQEAIDWLTRQTGGLVGRGTAGLKPARTSDPPPPLSAAALLQRVVVFYAKTFTSDRAGWAYLKQRNLVDPTMLEVFQIGYCNGTLRQTLPASGSLVEGLTTLGLFTKSGREHFEGCVTIPIVDPTGAVCGLYGRRIHNRTPQHLYLPGPHRGVWNGAVVKSHQTLLFTEGILDALSLWQVGFHNVVALYGAQGWTADHEALLREHRVEEVVLCLDNDDAGWAATTKLKEQVLPPLVQSVLVVQWPEGVKDANDFFLTHTATEFAGLLAAARPAGAARAVPTPPDEQLEQQADGFTATYGARRYEVRAIERPNAARLRATLKAVSHEQHRFHIDTVDLYLSRARRSFLTEAARLFREPIDVIEFDLNRLITKIEAYVEQRRHEEGGPSIVLVTEPLQREAERLGRHPDLVGELQRDLEHLGVVGETTNALVGYLVMTSRKLDEPLSFLLLSGSGAGKSHLQDTVLALCPEEEVLKLTALTGQALFYKDEHALRHKVLALAEEAGAPEAQYAIRNLISAKELIIEATIKNPLTGRLETQVNRVQGPTAVFLTTTNPHLDAETRSRFLVSSVDESSTQTRAILAAQRQRHTLDGRLQARQRANILARHHALQRLLKPLTVVNPYEPLLTVAEDRLLMRREQPKYLQLILAVTFLYQMQRPLKHHELLGPYIETTLEDIALAHELALGVWGQALEDLTRPSRELLYVIHRYVERRAVQEQCAVAEVAFTRRDVREFSGWSDYQIKTHVQQLEDLEYLIPLSGRRGQQFTYRLAWNGEESRFLPGLVSLEDLRRRAHLVGLPSEQGGLPHNVEGTSRPQGAEPGNSASPQHHTPTLNGGVDKEALADVQTAVSPLPHVVEGARP